MAQLCTSQIPEEIDDLGNSNYGFTWPAGSSQFELVSYNLCDLYDTSDENFIFNVGWADNWQNSINSDILIDSKEGWLSSCGCPSNNCSTILQPLRLRYEYTDNYGHKEIFNNIIYFLGGGGNLPSGDLRPLRFTTNTGQQQGTYEITNNGLILKFVYFQNI